MSELDAKSTKALIEYIGHKMGTGTTWSQLAKKLTQRGVYIMHYYAAVARNDVKSLYMKNLIGERVWLEFDKFLEEVNDSFMTNKEIKNYLLVKLETVDAPEAEAELIKKVILDDYEEED